MRDPELFGRLQGAARHLFAGFKGFTPIQREALPVLLARRPALLVGPTASGKTEAALGPVLHHRHAERWCGRPSVLVVAPTRALVNDLHRRLAQKLQAYVRVGRRTAEHRDDDAEVLITTPESLDSMLARGKRTSGHVLSGVRAVLVDELHFLVENARGAQLNLLLDRLDSVVGQRALRVAMTATLPDCEAVASRFLGRGATVVRAGGGRSLHVHGKGGSGPLDGRPDTGVDPLAFDLLEVSEMGLHGPLQRKRSEGPVKALVFVPSRRRCDELSTSLAEGLSGRSPVRVLAHHGSLSKAVREEVEREFPRLEEAVVVATSTLEIGIDIGDVNLVVLDGPPGSVSSLLQRIGRGNRRRGHVDVLPLAGNPIEACILASMLRFAARGEIDAVGRTAHYSVAVQQAASLSMERPRSGVTRASLSALWRGEFDGRAEWLTDELLEHDLLVAHGGRLRPGDVVAEITDNKMKVHANIGSAGGCVPLVDAVTGDAIAWVPRQDVAKRIVLAGNSYRTVAVGDAIELHRPQPIASGGTVRYAARRAPLLRATLRHLALGLGLSDHALVRREDAWIHFGGALFGELLKLSGLESTPLYAASDPRRALAADFGDVIGKHWLKLELLCGFGPFQRLLPATVRRQAVRDSIDLVAFKAWLESLAEVAVDTSQSRVLLGA